MGSTGQQEEAKARAAAAEGTNVHRAEETSKSGQTPWAVKASCGPVRKGEPLVFMDREEMGQVTLEAHPDGQEGGRKG